MVTFLNLLNSVSELCSGFELNYVLSLDSNGLLGCRIDALACSTLGNFESTETYESHFVIVLQSAFNRFERSVESFLCVNFAKTCTGSDSIY